MTDKVFQIETRTTIQDIDFNLSKLIEAFEGFVKRFAREDMGFGKKHIREKISTISVCQNALSLGRRILGNYDQAFDLKLKIRDIGFKTIGDAAQLWILEKIVKDISVNILF